MSAVRRLWHWASILILAASAGSAADGVQTQVPDFELKTPDGETVSLKSRLEAGPVLINFWTTWCKPCQKELPELSKLYEKYKDKGFTLLTVSEDDQRTQSKVRPTVKSRGYAFPVLLDPDHRVGNLFGVRNYPTNVLIASDGRIAVTTEGYRKGDETRMEKEILRLIEAHGAAAEEDEAEDEG